MASHKFGHELKITVADEAGAIVFATDGLRIDFDVRIIDGWTRAKFIIYNMAPESIKAVSNGTNYVTLEARVDGDAWFTVANQLYVSNAMEVTEVPNSLMSLFCYSKIRKYVLETPLDLSIKNPTIKNVIDTCAKEAGLRGSVKYFFFPEVMLNHIPPNPAKKVTGNFIDILEALGEEYSFNVYTDEDNLNIVYKPDAKNVIDTGLYTSTGDIKIDTVNLISNPKIGPASLSINTNLDTLIKPSKVLDISNLITATTETDFETLAVAENFLKDATAGFSKYQVLTVQHKGSNYTREWSTYANATSPTPGTSMNLDRWWA